jgi:hypothetical protein
MSAYEVITKTLEPFIKDPKALAKACNAVSTELDIGGWLTTDNDHLAMMRTALKRIHESVVDPDCTARDLAALTNRLQQFSAEVTTMEQKQAQEGKINNSGNTHAGTADSDGFDDSEV